LAAAIVVGADDDDDKNELICCTAAGGYLVEQLPDVTDQHEWAIIERNLAELVRWEAARRRYSVKRESYSTREGRTKYKLPILLLGQERGRRGMLFPIAKETASQQSTATSSYGTTPTVRATTLLCVHSLIQRDTPRPEEELWKESGRPKEEEEEARG
jgi:hypothetical protein